jgi:hypothetical protein
MPSGIFELEGDSDMSQLHHRHRSHPFRSTEQAPFPVYLVRESGHVPDIEHMMERHRLLRLGDLTAWLEHVIVQRVSDDFLLYVKLGDASQMSHHPEYQVWLRQALPLDEALGAGWRRISQSEAREMMGDEGQ